MCGKILKVADYWYPVTVFGPGNKLGIWFQGCSQRCRECISPEYQSYRGGKSVQIDELLKFYSTKKPNGLIISGGEPFDQPQALLYLVQEFEHKYGDDIVIYTGYKLEELQRRTDEIYREILKYAAVIIDGKYDPALNAGVGLNGSTNQTIHILKNYDKYKDADKWKREIMCVLKKNGSIWMIGVPPLV